LERQKIQTEKLKNSLAEENNNSDGKETYQKGKNGESR
jgi:hypothetical protein